MLPYVETKTVPHDGRVEVELPGVEPGTLVTVLVVPANVPIPTVDAATAEAAGAAAVSDARALPGGKNEWKIHIAKAMVKRAILACA